MYLLPPILNERSTMRSPLHRFDQNVGFGSYQGDLLNPVIRGHRVLPLLVSPYMRPWRTGSKLHSGVSRVSFDKDGFQVNLDVHHFKPEEIDVKVVDKCVVVKGKHEERPDEHGYIQRSFTRRYALPDSVNPETVVSTLSTDGDLTVSAAVKEPPSAANERVIPIAHLPTVGSKSAEKDRKKISLKM